MGTQHPTAPGGGNNTNYNNIIAGGHWYWKRETWAAGEGVMMENLKWPTSPMVWSPDSTVTLGRNCHILIKYFHHRRPFLLYRRTLCSTPCIVIFNAHTVTTKHSTSRTSYALKDLRHMIVTKVLQRCWTNALVQDWQANESMKCQLARWRWKSSTVHHVFNCAYVGTHDSTYVHWYVYISYHILVQLP